MSRRPDNQQPVAKAAHLRRTAWVQFPVTDALVDLCQLALRQGQLGDVRPFALGLLSEAESAHALGLAGAVFHQLGDSERAWQAFHAAVDLSPDDVRLQALLASCAATLAHWPSASRAQATLADCFERGDIDAADASPFLTLAWCQDDDCNRRVAAARWQRITANIEPVQPPALRLPVTGRPLRVGYLSADWYQHATLNLTAGLFEQHDPSVVEVVIYCHSPEDGSWLRERLKRAVPHFVDLKGLDDAAAAARIRADQLDVLVDCKGFTSNGRSRILAYRPAPIQVNWLAFPGSMGSNAHDYLIADPVVVPEGSDSAFSEAVCRLPESYFCNDNRRPVAANAPSRDEEGLPERGMVLCCFNQAYKLEPTRWATFMAILRDVPGSVLWLLEPGKVARDHLRCEAQAANIDPERLIFAPKRPGPLHLARLAHADLALDTRIYNGHTTTADALWVGVPVLAVSGQHFASRVSESLLYACGLPELVLPDETSLHARAVALANDPDAMRVLRERVACQRFRAPLFDTQRFTRHLEAAYQQMVMRMAQGQAPEALSISALPARRGPFAENIPQPRVTHQPPPEPLREHDPHQQWQHAACPVCHATACKRVAKIPWTEAVSADDGHRLTTAIWQRCRGCGHEYTRYHWAPQHPLASAACPVALTTKQATRLLREVPGHRRVPGHHKGRGTRRRAVWLEVRPYGLSQVSVAQKAGCGIAVMEAHDTSSMPKGMQCSAHRLLSTQIKAHVSVLSLPGVLACTPYPDLYLHRAARLLAAGAYLVVTVPLIDEASSSWPREQSPAILHRFRAETLRRLLEATGFELHATGTLEGSEPLRWIVARRQQDGAT